jgi:hypothetical protein
LFSALPTKKIGIESDNLIAGKLRPQPDAVVA